MKAILTDDERNRIIDSMGWSLDAQERGDMHRLIQAVLAKLAQQADRQRAPTLVQAYRTSAAYDVGFEDGKKSASQGCGRCEDNTKPCDISGGACAAPEAPAQASAVDERAAFEAELRRQCFQKPTTEARDLAWCMWQARAALAQKVQA